MTHAEQAQSAPAKPPPYKFNGELDDAASPGRSLLAISNEMVRIYKEQLGRGPTKTHTHYAGPDVLVCLFEHTLTPAERDLQRLGEHERLQDMRIFFQYAQAATFTEPIERITGRRVRAFMSGLDTNADIASELFVLEPDLPREAPHDPSGAEKTATTGTPSKTRHTVLSAGSVRGTTSLLMPPTNPNSQLSYPASRGLPEDARRDHAAPDAARRVAESTQSTGG